MSKKQDFIEFVKHLMEGTGLENDMPDSVKEFWDALKETDSAETARPLTENGEKILTYLQEHQNINRWKSRDIAEGLCISSRTASGAMRKLVTDGYLEKLGKDPIIYILTEKGKTFNIKENI
jgi:DNA-binding MarR family transcriptional regulator